MSSSIYDPSDVSVKEIFNTKTFCKAQKKVELGNKRLTMLFIVLLLLLIFVVSGLLLVYYNNPKQHSVTKSDFETLYNLISTRMDQLEEKIESTQLDINSHLVNHPDTRSKVELFLDQIKELQRN